MRRVEPWREDPSSLSAILKFSRFRQVTKAIFFYGFMIMVLISLISIAFEEKNLLIVELFDESGKFLITIL